MDTQNILGWAVLGTVILGNILAGVQGSKGKTIKVFWLGYLAVGLLVYWAIDSKIHWWITIVLGVIVYAASGMRMYSVTSQNHKLSRLFYFLLSDLVVVSLYGFVILPVFNYNFWTLVVFIVFNAVWRFAYYYIARAIFPIVSRQDIRNVYASANNKVKVRQLDAEIKALEYQALRSHTLKQLSKQQTLLNQANGYLSSNNNKQALDILNKVAQELELVQKDLTQEQLFLLGHTYLLRARAYAKQKQYSKAASDLDRASTLINVDENSLAEILVSLIDGRYAGKELYAHCIRFLYLRRGKQPDSVQQKILGHIHTTLAVQPGKSEKDYKEILERAREVIQVEPNLWWAHSALGKAAFLTKDTQTALDSLERAVRLYPNDRDSWTYLGMTYLQINRPQDARRAYEYSLSLDENQPGLAHELGVMILDDPRYQAKAAASKALPWLKIAVKLIPNNAAFLLDLARAAIMAEDKILAKKTAEEALAIDPKLLPAHLILGNIFYEDGLWEEAIPHFKILEGSSQAGSDSHLRLGHCYAEIRQWDDAVRLLEPIKDKDKRAHYPLGRAYLGRHEFGKAVEWLRHSVTFNDSNLPAWYALGCALAWQSQGANDNNLSESQICFERVVTAQHPLTAKAQLQLGHIAMRQRATETAIPLYQSAYKSREIHKEAGVALVKAYLAQNNPERAAEILKTFDAAERDDQEVHLIYGLVAEIQKDYEKASHEYRAAGAHGARGVVLYLNGKIEKAKTELALARAEGDQSDRVLYYSGLAHSQSGEHSQAIKEWQELLTRHPEDNLLELNIARSWYLLGCETYKQGDYVKTAEAWEHFYKLYSLDKITKQTLQALYLLIAFRSIGEPNGKKALSRARQLGAPPEMIRYADGLGAMKNKNWKEAVDIFRALLKSAPSNFIYQYNLGLALLFNQSYPEAEKHLQQVAKNSDENLHILAVWGLAAISASQGDWAKVAALTGE